jgi:hypothetical protein
VLSLRRLMGGPFGELGEFDETTGRPGVAAARR